MEPETRRISCVIKWANQMVMVFDQYGLQMGEFQGRYSEVREKILAAAGPETEYYTADWRTPGSQKKLDSF